ncbi:iron-sulfur cluster carrier protein ApbC [Candidatus Binatia bacterium]|nr:iron-sulfur cluster carrier protein ApbC [Candidatus Binatia bacterium]
MPTPQEILETLKTVKYPGLGRDIVSFGLVRDIEVGSDGITVILAPTTTREEAIAELRAAVARAVTTMPGVATVDIVIAPPPPPARRASSTPAGLPGVTHIVAVASGKGGVGKSTVAVNLALALARSGNRVGLLDADVYGPSVPLMLGLTERAAATADKRILPIDKFGIKIVSLGLFVDDRTPIIWRGPMLGKALTQFLRDVQWGDLDYLVIDLPPGTGDAQLTITQQVALTGGLIVTTPQDVALLDVRRGVAMFQQVDVPVLGVVENMSYHICGGCGARAELFGHGGGARMAAELHVPFLGEVPLVRDIRAAADAGEPIVAADPDHPQSRAFREIAQRLVTELAERRLAAKG